MSVTCVDGTRRTFSSSEQALMCQKALSMGDTATAESIVRATTPAECKRLGREVSPYDDAKWASVRYDIMVAILWAKFSQNSRLGAELVGTGNAVLAEASPTDCCWGIGVGVADAQAGVAWRGANLLGRALMHTRDRLALVMNSQ